MCGGYGKPKGHLDTQMFPECEGYPGDRDAVKKTRERRKNKKKKLSYPDFYVKKESCSTCGCGTNSDHKHEEDTPVSSKGIHQKKKILKKKIKEKTK